MSKTKAFLGCLLALTLCDVANAQDVENPLEPARTGNLLCITPDVEQRTCRSISLYSIFLNGSVERVAWTALQGGSRLVVRAHGPVTVRDHWVCETINSGTASAQFQRDGVDVPEHENSELQRALRERVVGSGELCLELVPEESHLRVQFRMNDVAVENVGDQAIWVSAVAGYRVGR